ncbi:MAG: hypothetical protein AAF962_12170 [Actinomycetota bacterium]
MIIAKGGPWGEPAPEVAPRSFASLGDLAAAALAAGSGPEGDAVGGVDGLVATSDHPDVLTQVGLTAPRPAADRYRFPFDLGLAELDGDRTVPFVAHLQAHRLRWAGSFAVAMNVGWIGDRYFGPRAHPNDGLLDITFGALGWRDRLAARRRLATGTHLPHPDLSITRTGSWEHAFDRPVPVFADGRSVGRATTLRVSCLPDRLTMVV